MKSSSVNSVEPFCNNVIIESIKTEGIGTAKTRNSKGNRAALYAFSPKLIINAPFKNNMAENTIRNVKSF